VENRSPDTAAGSAPISHKPPERRSEAVFTLSSVNPRGRLEQPDGARVSFHLLCRNIRLTKDTIRHAHVLP
jgi:hypothetical protein